MPLGEDLEDVGELLGRDAGAGVADADLGAPAGAAHPHGDVAAAGGELGGVVEEVRERLGEAEPVPADRQRLGAGVEAELDPRRVERGAVPLDRVADELGQVQLLALQLHLAAGDAGGFQEVVDQHRLVEDLALGGVDRPLGGAVRFPFHPQHLEGAADRAQGVAQLVGEHGQQLLLGAVGALEGGALLRQPQRDLLQPGLAVTGALELRHHPVDPLVHGAVAEHHVGGLVVGVGADLLAEEGDLRA